MHLDVPSEPPEDEQRYLAGPLNRGIRYYYYLENGLNIVNDFRNLILGIFAVALLLHIDDIYLIGGMFLGACIVLTITGYFVVHKVAKVKEWVNTRFSTHFGIRTFDYTRENNRILSDILQELKQTNADNKAKTSI